MVSTRGKKESTSSNKTLKENEAAKNALAETWPCDALTANVEDLKVDAQLEVEVETTVNEASKENPEGVTGEESERDEVGNENNVGISGEEESQRDEVGIDNYEGMSGEEESERVKKLKNDCQNTVVEEINGDFKVELAVNTFADGQEEMPWEDDEENSEHDNEEKIVEELDFSDEEASEEDNEDDVSEEDGEEATEDDDEESVSEEEDGEETTPEEQEIAKQDGTKVEANEDGRKIDEHNREKLGTRLRNKKIIQTNRRNVQADSLKKLDLKNKPESSRKRKATEDDDDVSEEEDGEPEEKEIAKQDGTEVEANKHGRKIEEHNREKLETRLKNKKKSIQTSRRNVQADSSKKLDIKNKPGSSRKRKAKKRAENMGIIFMCNSKTKKDCYQYRVFGLPKSKKDLVEKIYIGMRLFLYDVDLKLMYGIYKAAGPGGYNIEPKAFKSQFPSQVRFKVLDNCLPLPEEKFKNVIKDNYYTNTKFDCQLNSEQVKSLCKLFVTSSKGYRPKKSRKGRKAEKLPVTRERTRKRRVVLDRSLPLREEIQYEQRRKRPRNAMSPVRQHPAPLPRVPSSYAYERTSDVDAYRRNPYLDRRSPYRDRRNGHLDRRDPYEGRRDPPMEHIDHYGDGRDPYYERLYGYKDGRDPYVERRDPYIDDQDRDPYRRVRVPYRDGRDPYLELPNLYTDRQVPYIEGRSSYRDGRDTYLERCLPYKDTSRSELYKDTSRSELYGTYRRDPISDLQVDYRDSYRREEGRELHRSSNMESRPRHDSYVPTRERPAYTTDPLYTIRY